jgi:WD40 repeat protein
VYLTYTVAPMRARPLHHEHHKVPVTALAYSSPHVLLAGEGTHLAAYSSDRREYLGGARIFRSQATHKILINETTGHILVYGGSHVAFVTLSQSSEGLVKFVVVAQQDIGDWIFDAAFSPTPAHGALAEVALITAHNAFIRCTLRSCQGDSDLASISTETLVSGSNCILYCAHVSWLSASSCLVASGTAFGDIIIWSTSFDSSTRQDSNTKTHYIYQAHEGSVFGVQVSRSISQETLGGPSCVLASCSDDRTVRLWDISDLENECPSLTEIQRETGFGSTDQSNIYAPPLLAKAMGHISRIWSVHFLREEVSATRPLALASFGEDGSRITWEVKAIATGTGASRYELEQSYANPLHTGKNIWSAAVDNGRCATGGADGAIALLPSIERIPQTYEISNGLLHGPILDYPKDSYKSYAFVSPDTVVATTAHGRIVALTLDQDGTTSVETHASHESLKSFSVVVGGSGVSFVAGIGVSVVLYSLRARQCFPVAEVTGKVAGLFLSKRAEDFTLSALEGLSLLVTTVGSSTAQLLDIQTVIDHDKAVPYNSTQRLLSIAPGFVVTSFLLIRCGNIEYALLGSRKGVLNIYQIPDTKDREALAPIQSLQSCHSKESITAMRWKADVNSDGTSGHLFSTGRDGTYAVHRATNRDSTLSLELVHQLDLPFGPSIEGMAFTADSHLRIWGFGGKDFIAHDATTQQDVLTVRCGGRVNLNWAYDPDEHSIGGGGTFVWTQSSTLMRRTQSELPHYTIHPGGHGREIKAVALSTGKHQIIATGAEDTDIKLFAYSSASGFKCLQTLRKHNTGIQHLAWSVDSRHLFSSAGSEEFYVWCVTRDVPLIGLGVVCESAHPRTRTSDLRIMHFDVREQPAITGRDQEREGGAIFDITMAYSDSTLKRWLYNTSSRTWALQAEGDYLTACLTGVISLSPRDTNTSLVTTATDGHIALWNETPTSNDQQSSSSSSSTSTSSLLSWPHRRKIHQNAILASTTHTLRDASTLLITASDDNGIALSHLSSNPNSDPDVKALCSTLLIPRAHAAAVTALATYRCRKPRSTFPSAAAAATDADEQEDTFYLLSASIDQRIKAWEVQVDTTTPGNGSSGGGAECVEVRKVQNVYTSVADVSCMSLLRLNSNDDDGEDEGSVGVLVCGVGMDVWRM